MCLPTKRPQERPPDTEGITILFLICILGVKFPEEYSPGLFPREYSQEKFHAVSAPLLTPKAPPTLDDGEAPSPVTEKKEPPKAKGKVKACRGML